jgi:hypothetical protein
LSEQIQEVALTEEEKNTILSYCGPEPLLVGGQALAFWAVWFKIASPAELGDKVTTDADFVGSSKNARALNKQLHWTMWTPSLDDSTPQTAKLTKRVDYNGVKQIDFLHSIVGLDTKEIRKRAVAIARIALDKSLGNTLDRYELDPLKSIPTGEIEVPEFQAKRWPQLIETARVARESRANKAGQLLLRLRK